MVDNLLLLYKIYNMIQSINATQVRNSFADIINRVTYGGEEFVVERQGNPVVLITQIPKEKRHNYTISSETFLSNISKYALKDAPVNLAKNHDKYTWGK